MTELVCALGASERIIGIPAHAKKNPEIENKEIVASFITLQIDKIKHLRPDLILGFSDLQKDMARDLIGEGFSVFISNQRSLQEIGDTMLAVGRILHLSEKAEEIRSHFFNELDRLEKKCQPMIFRPRVYFEEWDAPMIAGIRWVSEIIVKMGGEDIFQQRAFLPEAKKRIVQSEEIISKDPEIILASWCGKKFQPEELKNRQGWSTVSALESGHVYEINSSDILSPGLSLLEGAKQIGLIYQKFFESFKP